MASPLPAEPDAGWNTYRRFSELIVVSVAGHFGFALAYGLFLKQWAIAAALAGPALLVLGLYPLFKSSLPPGRIRLLGHVFLLCNVAGLNLALMWMGLSASTAVWWLVWWPLFVAHIMGVVDGLIWAGLALGSAGLIWANQSQQWVAPHMQAEGNPIAMMQGAFLLIGVAFGVVVRRAHDLYEKDIQANQHMIDQQHEALERRAVKLEAMLQAVQQSSLERTRLFAQISHEVRTPLNGLLGFTQLLARTELNAQQTMHAEQIKCCGATLLQIINDVLDFSRLDTHATPLNKEPFKVLQLVNEAVDMMLSIAQQKGVSLVREFPLEEFEAVGDPLRVKQVMLNLLANAVKFTSCGEVAVRCRQLQLESGEPGLYVEVQDSGIGIPPNAIGHLFQPFSQASDATISQYGGSGLGLAVCKRLIDMMNGRIGVNSEPGKGSLFWFQLPLRGLLNGH